MHVFICMSLYACLYMCMACLYMYVFICMSLHVCLYMHVFTCMSLYACLYMYVFICMSLYVWTPCIRPDTSLYVLIFALLRPSMRPCLSVLICDLVCLSLSMTLYVFISLATHDRDTSSPGDGTSSKPQNKNTKKTTQKKTGIHEVRGMEHPVNLKKKRKKNHTQKNRDTRSPGDGTSSKPRILEHFSQWGSLQCSTLDPMPYTPKTKPQIPNPKR